MFLFNAVSKYLEPADRTRLDLMASLPLEQCVFGEEIAVPELSHYEISDDKQTKYVHRCYEGTTLLEGSYDDLTHGEDSHAESMTTLVINIVDVETGEVRGCIVNDLQLFTMMEVCQCIRETGDNQLVIDQTDVNKQQAETIWGGIQPLIIDRWGEHGETYMSIVHAAVKRVIGGEIGVEVIDGEEVLIVNNWLTEILEASE